MFKNEVLKFFNNVERPPEFIFAIFFLQNFRKKIVLILVDQ